MKFFHHSEYASLLNTLCPPINHASGESTIRIQSITTRYTSTKSSMTTTASTHTIMSTAAMEAANQSNAPAPGPVPDAAPAMVLAFSEREKMSPRPSSWMKLPPAMSLSAFANVIMMTCAKSIMRPHNVFEKLMTSAKIMSFGTCCFHWNRE